MVSSLSSGLKQRKSKLQIHLNNNLDSMAEEKQHQINGALDEIDHILKILEKHKLSEKPEQNKEINKII